MASPSSLDFTALNEVLKQITSRLVSSGDNPSALFEAVVQIAMETTQAQASSLYLEQADAADLKEVPKITMVAGAGYELHRVGKAVYEKGQGLTGWIWEQSSSVKYDTKEEVANRRGPWRGVFDDVISKKDPAWVCSSLVGVPLLIGDRTIGVIKVENKQSGPPAHFSDDDRRVLELIACTMALAIEDRRLSERAYSRILTALREVSNMLVSKEIIPFSALCDRIVNKCVEIFNAQACSLYLESLNKGPRDSTLTISMMAGAGYEVNRIGMTYKKGEGLTGSIWEKGQSVKFDTTADLEKSKGDWRGIHNEIIRQKVPNWICSSLIGAPLRIGTQTIGVIKVENKNPAPQSHFSHEELRSLEILASNIGLALQMLNRHREIFWQGDRARAFAHNIANQVRNALLNIQLCERELSGTPDNRDLDTIRERLATIEGTLAHFDDLGKKMGNPPAGRQHTLLEVKALIHDLLSRSDRIRSEKEITTKLNLGDTPIFVNVDRDQILQALGNILTNAIEALDNRQYREIKVEILHRLAHKEVAISIIDNGEGLKQEQREKFRHLGSLPSTKHSGIGVGLPEVSRCCQDNGGYLDIPDKVSSGVGGMFTVVLPTCNPKLLRLAIIEDDPAVAQTFRISLKKRSDVEATFFPSQLWLLPAAIEGNAISGVNLNDFDFILLDCRFDSGPNGVQILRELNRIENPIAKKVILMTGHDEYLHTHGVRVYDKFTEILKDFDHFIEASIYGSSL